MANETRIAISIGDPNGVGPEIILKTFQDRSIFEHCSAGVFAPGSILDHYLPLIGKVKLNIVKQGEDWHPRRLNVIWKEGETFDPEPGRITKDAGGIAYKSLRKASQAVINSEADMLLTAPINKANIQSDEFRFNGHTEFLGSLFEGANPLMWLMNEDMRVAMLTGHMPLKEVSAAVTKDAIHRKLDQLAESLKVDFFLNRPNIAVLGLNPHAGDDGLLGSEERDIITPAVESYSEMAMVAGPYGADGFFGAGMHHKYDAVLAMYHDQGLAPFKALSFNSGVNFTAGLPIVRTSPDHGTAYGLAGKGKAKNGSFLAALFEGLRIVRHRALAKEES